MKKNTKTFLKLIFEQEETKKDPSKKETSEKKETTSKEDPNPSAEIYNVATSNKISKGRPISDPGLTNIKHRAEASTAEAAALLKDLKIKGVSGSNWYQQTQSLYQVASSTELSALVSGAKLVKNKSGKVGVVVGLSSQWADDEKGGKRSYGFIRSLMIAAIKTGIVSIKASNKRRLRIEIVEGKNQALIYISKKALGWQG